MTERITPEQLADWQKATEAASHGFTPPWKVEPWTEGDVLRGWLVNAADATENYGTVLMAPDYGERFALWAATAREAMPLLIADVHYYSGRAAVLAEDNQNLADQRDTARRWAVEFEQQLTALSAIVQAAKAAHEGCQFDAEECSMCAALSGVEATSAAVALEQENARLQGLLSAAVRAACNVAEVSDER